MSVKTRTSTTRMWILKPNQCNQWTPWCGSHIRLFPVAKRNICAQSRRTLDGTASPFEPRPSQMMSDAVPPETQPGNAKSNTTKNAAHKHQASTLYHRQSVVKHCCSVDDNSTKPCCTLYKQQIPHVEKSNSKASSISKFDTNPEPATAPQQIGCGTFTREINVWISESSLPFPSSPWCFATWSTTCASRSLPFSAAFAQTFVRPTHVAQSFLQPASFNDELPGNVDMIGFQLCRP